MNGQVGMSPSIQEELPIIIQKASGEQEPFRIEKLKESLRKAGAEEEIAAQVAADISAWIYDGMSTGKIYARAFALLRKKKKQVASRYKLKQAIMELGPTGYPFERLIGKVIERQGFSVAVGQIVRGRCVKHEVDVVATRGHEQWLVECKYGLSAEKTVNVQVPLYVRSRVDDIILQRQESEEYRGFSFKGGVATNTRFTSDAIDYGTCSGLWMLSWDYPSGNGLKDIIDREKLYPITVLHTLTKKHKQDLLERGIVVCRQIFDNPEVVASLPLDGRSLPALTQELEAILR